MTKEEYFKEWIQVIPQKEMQDIIAKLAPVKNNICPSYKDIFKAFNKCPYRELKLVIIGQDPYPQRNIATGIAFANYNYPLSPSLQIIKNSVINYSVPHNLINFVPDLEDWEKQGVLLLNSSLTCLINKPNSHNLLWRPFISKLLNNICKYNTGIIFLLLGSSAQSFEQYINKNQYIIKEKHPSYYYRNHTNMPSSIWSNINKILEYTNGSKINFYKEYG